MSRTLNIVVAIALVFAACTSDVPAAETTITTAGSTAPELPEARTLGYAFEDGESLTYDVTATQDITFTARGDAEGLGEAPLPIDAVLVTESTGSSTYTPTDGTQAGTWDISISASFPDTRVAGTVNGATVDNLEEGGIEAELARIEPVDVTVTVDSAGRVLGDEGAAEMLGASLAALTGLTNDQFARPLGPVLPGDREVTVGDSWETITERSSTGGPVTVRSNSVVEDLVDGSYLIDTTSITDAFEVDFSEQFRQLFLDFADLEEDAEIPPEVQEQLDSIEFTISVEKSASSELTELDPATGKVRMSTRTVAMRLKMVFRSPDQTTGAITGFDISLDLAQTAVFHLRG